VIRTPIYDPAVVEERRPACPGCEASERRVRKTERLEGGSILRYVQCRSCGHKYKTLEPRRGRV